MGFLDKLLGREKTKSKLDKQPQAAETKHIPDLNEENIFKECITINFKEENETRTWSSEPEFSKILDPLNDGKDEIAIKESEKLVRKFDDFDLIYNWWASALLDKKSYDKAREVVQNGLLKAKRKFNLCIKAGEIEWKSGNLKAAVYYWSQAMHCQEPLKGYGLNYNTYLYLYYVAKGLDLSDVAANFIRRVDNMRAGKIRLDATTSENLRFMSQKANTPELKKVLNELDRKYFAFEALNDKGKALENDDKYDEAIQAYNKAIEANTQFADAWLNKGSLLKYLKKYDEAIQALDKATELNPDSFEAWYNKGQALESLEKYEEAVKAFDNVIKLKTKDDPAWHLLHLAWHGKAKGLEMLGKYDEAVQAYDKVIEIYPPCIVHAGFNKGRALYKFGKNEDAIKAFDEVIADYSRSSDYREYKNYSYAWYFKGNALKALGRQAEADAAFALVDFAKIK